MCVVVCICDWLCVYVIGCVYVYVCGCVYMCVVVCICEWLCVCVCGCVCMWKQIKMEFQFWPICWGFIWARGVVSFGIKLNCGGGGGVGSIYGCDLICMNIKMF